MRAIRISLQATLVTLILTGLAYPLALWLRPEGGVAHKLLFEEQFEVPLLLRHMPMTAA